MLNSFEISHGVNDEYSYNYKLSDDLVISYNHEDIFNSVSKNDGTIISYGYCFDVRNPETDITVTLNTLLNDQNNILENIKYLNGHFILLFNLDGNWKLITDAVSITPIYFDAVKALVTVDDTDELPTLNGASILDLQNFTLSRIDLAVNKLSDERIERTILDLVSNQYKYFLGKDLTLNFRRNKMNKAIISILRPVLINQTLNLRENDDTTLKIGNGIAREYKMELLAENEQPSTIYLANTHLMDYKFYMKKNSELADDELDEFNNLYNLDNEFLKARSGIEYNLLNKLNYRNEPKPQLIYDPFNVIAIQEIIYCFSDASNFDTLTRIVKILHPAIDFYDFASGETLMQKYTMLKKQTLKMTEALKKVVVNQEFLREADEKGIIVSDNLDGKILEKGITFFPASKMITKEDIYEVTYKKEEPGMVLIESYFNNPKNAHRIKVCLNGDVFNIDEFLEGKFIDTDSKVHLKFYYQRNYDAVSWQKAGKITIKELV